MLKSTRKTMNEFLKEYPDMPTSFGMYQRRLRAMVKKVRQETIDEERDGQTEDMQLTGDINKDIVLVKCPECTAAFYYPTYYLKKRYNTRPYCGKKVILKAKNNENRNT